MIDLIIFEFKYDFCNDMCVNGYEKNGGVWDNIMYFIILSIKFLVNVYCSELIILFFF